MALEHILKKIREETDVKLSEIDSRMGKKLEEITKEGDEKIAELREELLHKAEEKIEQERRSRLALTKLDFRKELLSEKRRLLDETFRTAFEDIRNSSDDDYRKLIKKLILQAAESGNGKIFISNKDRTKITKSLIDEINEELHKEDNPVILELAADGADIDGGFILKMGKIEINCSLSSFFKEKREELESEVSNTLKLH